MKDNSIKEKQKLKIGMLNLEAGRGTTNNYLQYGYEFANNFWPFNQNRAIETAGKFIRNQDIDIMCLTEVEGNGGSLRSKHKDQVELISKISGLPYRAYFETYTMPGEWMGGIVNFDTKRKLFRLGNAILSKHPLDKRESIKMNGGQNPRVLGKVTVDFNGTGIDVYSTQLALGEKTRHKQMDYISKIIQGDNLAILGADINEQKEEKLEELAKKTNMEIAKTTPTYPSWDSTRTLDYIMTRGLKITDSRTHNDSRFSDHLPITANVYFEK